MSAEIIGLPEVEAMFREEATLTPLKHQRGMAAGAKVLQGSIAGVTPRRTGRLAASIRAVVTGFEAVVGSFGVAYARMVAQGVPHSWEEPSGGPSPMATPFGVFSRVTHGPIRANDFIGKGFAAGVEAAYGVWKRLVGS
jgi:hypothetical protein